MPPKARPSRGAAGDAQVVARIGKPHGIRGEVTVQLHTDDPGGRFTPGTIFPTRAPAGSGTPKALTVRSARDHNGIWLLGFEEIPDRTGAEGLRGSLLLLPAEAPEVEDDAWYADDLVGLRAERPDGSLVGTVTGLVVGAAQDRLVLDLAGGGTAEVPFVRALVPVVDVPGGRVVVDPPEGLLELGS